MEECIENDFPVDVDEENINVKFEDESQNIMNSGLHKKLQSPNIFNIITTPIAVSEGEMLMMFLKFAITLELSHTAVTELFKALNTIFQKPILPDTRHFIDKLFFSSEFVKYHAVCPHCGMYVGVFVRSNVKKECENCHTTFVLSDTKFKSFFATFNNSSHLKTLLERNTTYHDYIVWSRVHERGVYQ